MREDSNESNSMRGRFRNMLFNISLIKYKISILHGKKTIHYLFNLVIHKIPVYLMIGRVLRSLKYGSDSHDGMLFNP